MKFIKSPAIQLKVPPANDLVCIESYCHQGCYDIIRDAYEIYASIYPEMYGVVEGFTLTDGSFVNRFDAMKIARTTNQVLNQYRDDEMLFSYKISRFGGPCEN